MRCSAAGSAADVAAGLARLGVPSGTILLIAAPCALVALVAVLFIREVPLRTTIEREDEPVQVR